MKNNQNNDAEVSSGELTRELRTLLKELMAVELEKAQDLLKNAPSENGLHFWVNWEPSSFQGKQKRKERPSK